MKKITEKGLHKAEYKRAGYEIKKHSKTLEGQRKTVKEAALAVGAEIIEKK